MVPEQVSEGAGTSAPGVPGSDAGDPEALSAREEGGGTELLHGLEGDLLGLSDPAVKAVLAGMRVSPPETGLVLSQDVLPDWASRGLAFLWNPAGALWCWQHLVILFTEEGLCAASGYYVLPDDYMMEIHRTAYGDSESWLKIACWFLHAVYAEMQKSETISGDPSYTLAIDGVPFGVLDVVGAPVAGLPMDVLMKSLISHHVALTSDVEAAVREAEGFRDLIGPLFRGRVLHTVVYK